MRIAGAGKIAMFMQSTAGLIICVVLPILLIVGYDILRRRNHEKSQKEDTDALLAELEALRAEKAEKEMLNLLIVEIKLQELQKMAMKEKNLILLLN